VSEETDRPAPLVVALGADLIFASRLASMVDRVGGQFVQARDEAQLRRVLSDSRTSDPLATLSEEEGVGSWAEAPNCQLPILILIDLGGRGLDLAEAVRSAKAAGSRLVVAYGPHKDVAARRRALDAGCDRWLPNSKLFEALPSLLLATERG
jgi:DNA-binding NarL/FixJ family response regulator